MRRKDLTGTKSTDWDILYGVRKIDDSGSVVKPIKAIFIPQSLAIEQAPLVP
jgi:hypothetical protein